MYNGRLEPLDDESGNIVPKKMIGGFDTGHVLYPDDGRVRIASIRSLIVLKGT